VAITFALSLLVLFGFMALVFDLGRTYVVRTELQNAADAAALAGAKDLNQKLSGITQAIATVKAIGLQNNTKFSFNGSTGVVIEDAMISVSNCPYTCPWTQASTIASDSQAADKTFIKVDIPSGGLATFFAGIAGNTTTRTFGLAVAGFYVREITPIGICAIDLNKGGTHTSAAGTELTEFGFRRGVAYNIMELGPLGGSGQPYLLNPVDSWGSPACDASHSSATYTAPFICTGTSAAIGTVPGNALGNTGISAGPIEEALNSRFKVNACAPQDANVKEYTVPHSTGPGLPGNPRDWTDPGADVYPLNDQQSITIVGNKPVLNPAIGQYGALWSYSRAVQAVGTSPNASAGVPFTLADWPDLYAGNTADQTASGYPASPSIPPFPAGTLAAPYNTLSGSNYFVLPPITPGKRDRRVLNLAIVNCPGTGTGCNSTIPIVGIGRFFMQVEADLPKSIEAEFAGLIDPLPPPIEIRLYK
jgi:Flp pilus assembly protein TadG